MTTPPSDDAETPMQRALRLKKAALEANAQGRGSAKANRKSTAPMPAGASKPWMKK